MFAGQCQDWEPGWRTLDSARMAPKRATALLLLVTISTQVYHLAVTLWHLLFCHLSAKRYSELQKAKQHKGSGQLIYVPQVLGEPGVWSALSFLGGNAAGKRSTDETQVSWIIQLSTVSQGKDPCAIIREVFNHYYYYSYHYYYFYCYCYYFY